MGQYKDKFDLTGKVAIVTGASKGIGEAICRGFAEYGAKVVVSSRKQEAVDKVAQSIVADGGEAIGIACHVGDSEACQTLVDQTIEKYGGVDILVNNAATNPAFGPLETMTDQIFDKIMDINVKSVFLLSNHCLESMKSRGGGSIINISSVEGLRPSLGMGLYGMTKKAVIALTQHQGKEWGPHNVRANVICPGLVKTKLSAALWGNEAVLKQVENHLPLKRMASTDEMVGLALLLASNASTYITGGVFTNDGGHMLS